MLPAPIKRCTVTLILASLLPLPAQAHWIQVHEAVTRAAVEILQTDPQRPTDAQLYVEFLTARAKDPGDPAARTNLDVFLKGVRDADLRANGIYAIDCHCELPMGDCSACPEDHQRWNDIGEWPIGDHGYQPRRGDGFWSDSSDLSLQDETIRRVIENPDDPRTRELLKVVGSPNNLRHMMRRSNAKAMTEFFYQRAREEWLHGNVTKSLYNLGIAVHVLQDVSVPHHVYLIRGGCTPRGADYEQAYERFGNMPTHCDYERYVWEDYLKMGPVPAEARRCDLREFEPGERVRHVAGEAWGLDITSTPKAWKTAAASVALAVSASTGMIATFLREMLTKHSRFGVRGTDVTVRALPWGSLASHCRLPFLPLIYPGGESPPAIPRR
jgi:hypothetical protein